MADLNGAGGAVLGGLNVSSTGETHRWTITPTYPPMLYGEPTTSPTLKFRLNAWNSGGAHNVRLQLATDAAFTALVLDIVMNNLSGDPVITHQYPTVGLVDGTTYYWRLRVEEGPTLDDWTSTMIFRVTLRAGDAVEYVYMNVGAAITLDPDVTGVEFNYMNVGAYLVQTPLVTSREYNYLNIGMEYLPESFGLEYQYLDVTEDPPQPVIWFLSPPFGREGDGFEVVGWGFGVLPEDYSATVEVELEPGVWTAMPVVTFQTYPATADAYNDNRVLDPMTGEVDWQHTRIAVLIPPGAEPPGYPVRVRTVTP